MTALLLAAVLAAPPVVPSVAPVSPAAVAFERLKKLQGSWKSKDGRILSVRAIAAGGAVLASITGGDGGLASVSVFRLEGGELVAAHDGASHGLVRLASASEKGLRLEARPDAPRPTLGALVFGFQDADSLTLTLVARGSGGGKDVEEATDFKREYVETLK